MSIISKENVIKAFYYLLSVDGNIDDDELNKFEELAKLVDSDFDEKKQSIFDDCNAKIAVAKESDEYYEMIVESFDKAVFADKNTAYDEVSPRLIVWDMYTLSYVDGELSNNEKRFINHAIRFLEVDKSVSLEMEQMCKTYADIEKEIHWAENSDRKYSSIKPLVSELRERQKCIAKAAKALIEDDMYVAKPIYIGDEKNATELFKDVKPGYNLIGESMIKASKKADKVAEKFGGKLSAIGEKSGKAIGNTVAQVSEVRKETSEKAGKFIGDIAHKINESRTSANIEEENGKEE